jgi:hypothetical protein
MIAKEQQRMVIGDRLYERLGKPLEAEHWGKFIAITEGGEYLVRENLIDLLEAADDAFEETPFVFKIGEKAVGTWHRPIG